jgi:protein-S-isoprenylcysteine O-methyltransferase Ste14
MTFAFFFSIHLVNAGPLNPGFAIIFFLASTTAYIVFLYLVLPENGLRHWFVKSFGGETEGYLAYEAVLSFLFFINGASIGYINVAFAHSLPLFVDDDIIRSIALLLFVTGWVIKIWATKVVGIDIYYWKDMFCGRKISHFVAEGPYKFFSNPMYGLGQLQTYATSLWYLSLPGLIAAAVYQLAVFSFYLFQEKKFIYRVYLQKTYQQAA